MFTTNNVPYLLTNSKRNLTNFIAWHVLIYYSDQSKKKLLVFHAGFSELKLRLSSIKKVFWTYRDS